MSNIVESSQGCRGQRARQGRPERRGRLEFLGCPDYGVILASAVREGLLALRVRGASVENGAKKVIEGNRGRVGRTGIQCRFRRGATFRWVHFSSGGLDGGAFG
jgi:hypothetical protein